MSRVSTRKPLNAAYREKHIALVRQCIEDLRQNEAPRESWRIVSDVVNMCETFVVRGQWLGCDLRAVVLADDDRVILAGIHALVKASRDDRLSDDDHQALCDLLEPYEEIISTLPHAQIERCRNITRGRIAAIVRGACQPHDVVVGF